MRMGTYVQRKGIDYNLSNPFTVDLFVLRQLNEDII